MARSYRPNTAKSKLVYDVDGVMETYRVCRNTVSNWMASGLVPTDEKHPILFVGAELLRFHANRSLKRKRKLKIAEFPCLSCKTRVVPDHRALNFNFLPNRSLLVSGHCPECSQVVMKILNASDCNTLRLGGGFNTTAEANGEEDSAIRGETGINADIPALFWNANNERVLHLFLAYARRYHVKTIHAIFASIRDFESFLNVKAFDRLKPADIDEYRTHLLQLGKPEGGELLSRSTIIHRASHIRGFLDWLVKQDGYRRLNPTLASYAVLPRGESAALLKPTARQYPTLTEATAHVQGLPTATRVNRRDQAIVSALYLLGLRAETMATIRFRDIDIADRSAIVDARTVKSKNGKSIKVCFFPTGNEFELPLSSWMEEMRALGAMPEDPLFPPNAALEHRNMLVRRNGAPIAPWASSDAIRRIFTEGCKMAGLPPYTPHAAKHCLADLGRRICRTEEEHEAWSKNLAHETRQITVSHYAKMGFEHRQAVMARIHTQDIETEQEKDLLLAYFEHRLMPGTVEFEQAERLHDLRRQRYRGFAKAQN